MPDTKNINYNELADELEMRGIKYKISYARGDNSESRGIVYSVTPKTLFASTEEITITIH
jgi:beta-lactam-binding protein with PASTA domain